jgi:uncharacterized phage protein gp47/JayE
MGQLTDSGYVVRRLDDIIASMDAGMRAIYGSDINTDPDSPDGQMIGIYSQALADLEELAGEMWRQMDPDYASGPNLDRIVAFAGLKRYQSNPSTLKSVILSGTAKTPIPADSVVKDPGGETWHSMRAISLDLNGSGRVDFQSVDNGSFSVSSNVVLSIVSGVTGWKTATTSSASLLGTDEETDPQLRARFYDSRERTADDDRAALEGNLLALPGVDDARVYENWTDVLDANGVNPHAINAVVDGGDDQSIALQILYEKPAGTGMQGNTTVYVIDEFSRSRAIYFDRPTQVNIFVVAQVTRRENFTDIDTSSIIEALAATNYKIGQTVIYTELYGVMYDVPGFIVKDLKIGKSAATVAAADIPVGPRDKAIIDPANVTITIV